VGQRSGFGSVKRFTETFREVMGDSPSVWRKRESDAVRPSQHQHREDAASDR
jgi:AraC-like DNA-binding protein